ncbi:hypothetical protein COB11_01620 [Candidatus Aerophobetes bacterium]|uniref:Uncharacterized protein n=1 Tax=Aerophobetes bacterium TaxID=2030807 RepID=A0A2A4YLG1_UNCAE|nr:MAG: hypothetical protein COB11_01620 [Candidatus Aerophobetes bacterium]
MDDEFDKIMEFFSLNPEDKAVKLEDIFEDSIEFFNKFQYVLENGTEEEKAEILGKVMELQEKLQEETEKMCTDSGLTEEELKEFANDKKNFTDEEWETITHAKSKLDDQAEQISKHLPGNEPGPAEIASSVPKKKKKKKGTKRKGGDKWVKS